MKERKKERKKWIMHGNVRERISWETVGTGWGRGGYPPPRALLPRQPSPWQAWVGTHPLSLPETSSLLQILFQIVIPTLHVQQGKFIPCCNQRGWLLFLHWVYSASHPSASSDDRPLWTESLFPLTGSHCWGFVLKQPFLVTTVDTGRRKERGLIPSPLEKHFCMCDQRFALPTSKAYCSVFGMFGIWRGRKNVKSAEKPKFRKIKSTGNLILVVTMAMGLWRAILFGLPVRGISRKKIFAIFFTQEFII